MTTRFDVTVRIAGARPAVEAALVNPGFYPELGSLPAIDDPVVLHCERSGERVELRVRYRFSAQLPAAARRVVDPNRLTWIDETVVDLSNHTARFHITPEHYEDRFRAHGRYVLDDDGGVTVQRLSGEVKVRLPIVGAMAERGIVRGLRENVEREGELLERWIAAR